MSTGQPSSLFHCIDSEPYAQVGTKFFQCRFYEVPCREYGPNCFPDTKFDIGDPGVHVYTGLLEAQLSEADADVGAFKTAHVGKIKFVDEGAPLADGKVCVKQVFRRNPDGTIKRYDGKHELAMLSVECNCLIWASILLDLTYKFVAREIEGKGELSGPIPVIPKLRFTRSMIALVQDSPTDKAFLVEEWIALDDSEHPFIKYMDNCYPQSTVPLTAHPEAHEIAEFLIFAQHVQWQKSDNLVYTSDYQGAGGILTDPQITSNP